ncbi:hypothetical protein DFA_01924 [Cavenderia fasciculata]|uniref:Uncharacterized protein n=1 Tax=Cavenderia fasciculata TaxID=261658 RepID=F4PQS7_CACFS|nr:uncharacterized protein DFA_01924 [Cavenderia fasciculata]EGG22035.1 hypothetical protein DFA_01924 [Cavenderia fasciculata]|eukprot:XP_004359886.1 hypothetical protein DFA_01924 [Cavenderia fasciculata]
MTEEIDRFKNTLEIIYNVESIEECIDLLYNKIIECSDVMNAELEITREEVVSCYDIVEILDKRFCTPDDDQHLVQDYKVFVTCWILTLAILNRLKDYCGHHKSKDRKQLLQELKQREKVPGQQLQLFLKYRSFKDLPDLFLLYDDQDNESFNESELSNQLIPFLNHTFTLLPIMLEDIKDDKKQLFSLIGIRGLFYIGNGWNCHGFIVNVEPLMTIFKDSFDSILSNHKDTKYIHLICNNVSRLIANLTFREKMKLMTLLEKDQEMITNEHLKFLGGIFANHQQENLELVLEYSLLIVGNLTATKVEWRDTLVHEYGLMDHIYDMMDKKATQLDYITSFFTDITSIEPPLDWNVVEIMCEYACRNFMSDKKCTRDFCLFLQNITLHPDSTLAIIRQYRLDQYSIDTLNQLTKQLLDISEKGNSIIHEQTEEYLLEVVDDLLLTIFNVNSLHTNNNIYTFDATIDILKRLLQSSSQNYRIMYLVLYTLYDVSKTASIEKILACHITQHLTKLVLDYASVKCVDQTQSGNDVPVDKQFQVDDFIAQHLIFNVRGLVDQILSDDQFKQLTEQGLLLLYCQLHKSIVTDETFALYDDCFNVLANHNLEPHTTQLLKQHLFQLDFHNTISKSKPSNLHHIRNFLLE